MPKTVHAVIHHLNPWGGHDRSTLEILRSLNSSIEIVVHAYELIDPKASLWKKHRFCAVKPHLKKPAAAVILYFYLVTGFRFFLLALFGKRKNILVHSTGACSFISDVVQVQFVSKSWRAKQKLLDSKLYQRPLTRGKSGIRKELKKLYHRTLLRFNVWTEERIYTNKKKYIAIADCVAEELKENFGIRPENICVIRHGVDHTLFSPRNTSNQQKANALRTEVGVPEGSYVWIFVGEFERKGLAPAIDALSKLSVNEQKKIALLAVGGGDVVGFKELAMKKGVSESVFILGHKKNIQDYFQAADVFVLPTFYEPFGLVIIEAMACGLAPVVSRCAGGAELIEEGVSGRLIQNPESSEEIAQKMRDFLKNPAAYFEMGKKAREVAVARTWDVVAGEYKNFLEPLRNS